VLVEAADGRVAEEHAAAAIGLETVLVGVDHNRVSLVDDVKGAPGGLVEGIGNEAEVATIGGVDVDTEAVAIAEGEDLIEGVDRAHGGGAERSDDGAHVALSQLGFESVEVHASAGAGRYRRVFKLEHAGDAVVGVVGLFGTDDAFAGSDLAGGPEGLEVGDGAAGGEVAEVFMAPPEHVGDLGDGFHLHFGACTAAVAGVVVGIEGHGQRVGGAGDGVRRLEHLAGVEGVEIGVVVTEAAGGFIEHGAHGLNTVGQNFRGLRQVGELVGELRGGASKESGNGVRHRVLSHAT